MAGRLIEVTVFDKYSKRTVSGVKVKLHQSGSEYSTNQNGKVSFNCEYDSCCVFVDGMTAYSGYTGNLTSTTKECGKYIATIS